MSYITDIKDLLSKKYFFLEKTFKANFIKSFILSAFFVVYLFLIVNNETIPFQYILPTYLGFGVILYITFIFSFYYIPKYMIKVLYDDLSVKKYLFWLTITLFFGYLFSYIYHSFIYSNELSVKNFLSFILKFVSLVFPLTLIILLLDYISSLKNKIYDIESINRSIAKHNKENIILETNCSERLYSFQSDNKSEKLTLQTNKVLFVNGADNYVDVHFINEENAYERRLIRSKIKTIETDILNDFLTKTHRSYLCNLNLVSKISKDSGSYFLHFAYIENKIPISAMFTEDVLNTLNSSVIAN
ncbi:LytTR family transcriptional regulator DNA-binding domain-containing protein [Flavobacterium sp.]|uniref:LytTR family transcriptional regulator DNA-binding domain-containing protein n=1 Tax=Flavobacterium sp. TaxID=239 RepID=UPI00286E006E|nr:LytTR family transcriptional regulator DNA-binding domain-containing protein [Flavobacterium sp.]